MTDTLWARNTSSEAVVLSLYAVDTDSTFPEGVSAADDFQLVGPASSTPATRTSIARVDPRAPIARAILAAGEDTEIALRVGLPESSGTRSQHQSVSIEFVRDFRAWSGSEAMPLLLMGLMAVIIGAA